jgi:hypothetical protein
LAFSRTHFQFVQDRVLRFLFPVEQEHVLEQGREFVVRLDAGAVMRLREQLDQAGQRQYRPGRLAQHDRRNVVRPRQKDVPCRHAGADQGLDPAKQLLVLQFFVGEAHQRLERDLVAEPVVAALLEDLGADETLDQAEDVGVGAALDLRQQAALAGIEERQLVGE